MPKDLDSIMFTICIYTHLQQIQGMLLAMGMITADIFLLRQSDIGTNVGKRIVDYYKHVDSDWIQFYSANQIIGILLQAHGQMPSSFTTSFPPHFTCFAFYMK
jgi:hypothetical protein